jgi:proline dehydrogenase
VSLVDSAIVRLLPAVPKPVVRRISERYIAGEELDDALRVVRRLNGEGKLATIDVLGEEIANAEEEREIAGV